MSNALSSAGPAQAVLNGVSNDEVTITSVELTEIINKFRKEEGNTTALQHRTLLESIRRDDLVLSSAGIAQQNFLLCSYKDKNNRDRTCFRLNKAGVIQMLNKESAIVRYRTIKYIEKLEKQNECQLAFTPQVNESLQSLNTSLQAISQILQSVAAIYGITERGTR